MYESYKEMSGAQEAQKAKALWATKATRDRNEEFYDPACEEDISKRNETRIWSCGKNISRIQLPRWTKH